MTVVGRRRRVLMVHCYYRDVGGENLSFEAEVELLRRGGVEVITYTRDNRELDEAGVIGRIGAGFRTVWSPESYGAIRALVRRERPDVVHIQNTFPLISPAAAHAAGRLGVPVVQALRNYRILCAAGTLYRDGGPCHDCVGKPVPYPAMLHACYHDSRLQTGAVVASQIVHGALGTWRSMVDLYIAPTEFARQVFVDAGLPADRIVVKPNFIDPDPGPNADRGRAALFTGRLAPEKGIMTVLDAWRRIHDLPLRIAGDGPLRGAVEAYIETHGLADRVRVLGHQDPAEVIRLLRDTSVAIFASEWYETFGRVAAEAFACGVPVVASRLGAMQELVHDGENGRLFDPGDPDALAAAVRAVIDAPDGGAGLAAGARASFERSFTAEQNLAQLLSIYDRVLAVGRAQPMPADRPAGAT